MDFNKLELLDLTNMSSLKCYFDDDVWRCWCWRCIKYFSFIACVCESFT